MEVIQGLFPGAEIQWHIVRSWQKAVGKPGGVCVCSGPEEVKSRSELTGALLAWVSLGMPVSQAQSFMGMSHGGTH